MICLPSTLPGREGGLPHRAAFHQSLETLRISADPDFRRADQGLSHFLTAVDTSLRSMELDTGIEPATNPDESRLLYQLS